MSRTLRFRWCKYATEQEEEKALAGMDLYNPGNRDKSKTILDFNSPEFFVENITGEIWPERFQYVVFNFTPPMAVECNGEAYLVDLDSGKRLKVTMKGIGLPPDARFLVDTINIGHVPLDSILEYELVLANEGKVTIDFEVENRKQNGLLFEFIPNSGQVPVGESRKIGIKFSASTVGQFNESFLFHLKGSATFKPSIVLYGKVIGPDLLLSTRYLNFGDLSYGFLYVQTFEIENKSEIPFEFEMRPIQDNTFSPREFNVIPSSGTVPKFGKLSVQVEFVPITVQRYHVKLAVDVCKVGKAIETITMVANCCCPSLRLAKSTIDFDKVFIGRQYEKNIEIIDDSEFPAKYEFCLPAETSVAQAAISVAKVRGVINAQQTLPIKLYMTPQVLGPIKIPAYVRAYGSESPPIPFTVTAVCTGPNITLSTQHLNFGNVQVLSHANHKVIVNNESLIPAVFTVSINSDYSVWKVEPMRGEIEPNGQCPLTVTANLNDTVNFTGRIMISFQHLNPIYIDISATGVGTPIVSSMPMNTIDFDYILNDHPATKEFTITNYGRRSQELRWSIGKPKIDENALRSFSFKIEPEQVVVESGKSITARMTALCSVPCTFSLPVQCHATLGRQRSDLWGPNVKGVVIKPVLSFSKNTIEFEHRHDAMKEEALGSKSSMPARELMPTQTETFIVKNNVQLPLDVDVEIPMPFKVTPSKLKLAPDEEVEMEVSFIASWKEDFCSEVLNRRIVFIFKNHPQRLYVNVKGQFTFPNINFSQSKNMNFGNMMLNTEQTKEVTMSVASDMDVEWSWQLISDDPDCDISRIFDVFPIRGKMSPGQSDKVHFSFFASGGDDGRSNKYDATAICHVVGGPDYVMNLLGGAAAINYKIEPLKLDFGSQTHDEQVSQQITLKNLSDVAITYSAKIPKGCKLSQCSVHPSEGTIGVAGTVVLNVTVMGGLPSEYNENFLLQIGHFGETKIPIHLDCHFPQVKISLPRASNDPAKMAVVSGEDILECEKRLMIDRLSDKLLTLTGPVPVRRRRGANDDKFNGYILSRYCLDTGAITVGEHRTWEFELVPLSPFPISFEVKTSALRGTGFSIEPLSAANIPPNTKFPVKVIFDTTHRTNSQVGKVDIEVPVRLTDELGFAIHIRSRMHLPSLNLSSTSFNFEDVIVGQTKIMTLQLQNMNTIPCEFKFGEPDVILPPGVIKPKKTDEEPAPVVYSANPATGILPPSAFQNIELSFSPVAGGEVPMQIPLNVKYNTQPRMIKLDGVGVQMRVVFDPPTVQVPSIMPFNEPSTVEVEMVNPTNYPIEVFSYHFDYDLFCDSFKKEQPVIEDIEENVVFTQQNASVSKFSICVIVHGAHTSGCTTIVKNVAEHLNVPIIRLQDLWADLLKADGSAAADYTAKFFAEISKSEYTDGFVVDSLHVFSDGKETDQFILSSLKAKNLVEETINNPFNAIPHQNLTGAEFALSYIVAALDGHYVFFVGVRTTFEIVTERLERIKNIEKRRKRQESQNEKDSLFNMTEEEYEALTDEQKEEIDKKRKQFRKKLVRSVQEEMEANGQTERSRHGHRHKKKEGDDKDGDKKHSRSRKEESTKTEEKPMDSKRKRPQVPTDPNEHSVLLFNLIAGSLAMKIRESGENFQALDAMSLKKSFEAGNEEEEEVHTETADKKYIYDTNSMLLEAGCTEEEAAAAVVEYIPKLQLLKEAAFTDLIPGERVTNSSRQPPPKTKFQEAPSFFSIVNDEPRELPDFGDDDDAVSRGSRSKKGGRTSRSKTQNQSGPITDFDTTRLTNRWRIEPNSRCPIQVKFNHPIVGNYKADLLFGLSNCTCDIARLPCSGVCGHPNIARDIKTIFAKRVPKADYKTENAFCMDTQEFTFGSILISKDKLGKNQSPVYQETIHLTNPTPFPAHVTLTWGESKAQWVAEPPNLVIEPGATSDVKIGVHATIVDSYKNTLSIFVTDQPDPFYITCTCEACIPSVEIANPVLDFERLLLKQSRTLTMEIKNSSRLPTFWRLKGANTLGPTFTFNASEGLLQPRQSFHLKATYTSPKPFGIKKAMAVEILDKTQTKVYNTIQVPVSAESFDVLYDFQYPKGMDHLQYGAVKVMQAKTIQCTLKNRGKFPVKYKVVCENKIFDIQPSEGQIGGNDKPLAINFTIKAPKVVTYKNAKGISIQITDPNTGTTTSTLPVPFSCESMYSQFSISPSRKVDFGSIPISTVANSQIVLKNEGRFPFEFNIIGKVDEAPQQTNGKDKKGKAQPQQKPRGKKGAAQLQVGNYGISPSTGSLNPGASVTIDMDFQSPTPDVYKASLTFKISDSDPSLKESDFVVRLQTNNVVPGVVMTDYEKMFPGMMLCLRYDMNKVNRTVFIEDEQVLHFQPMIIQRKAQVEFALVNNKPVPCTIDMSIKPKTKAGNSNFPFDLSEKTVSLGPNSKKVINIGFNPMTCDSFVGFFEGIIRGAVGDAKFMKFNIEGVGTLPTVTIPSGMEHGKGTLYTASLGRTLVGFTKEKTITIANETVIDATVKLTAKPTTDFEVVNWNDLQEFTIPPGKRQDLTVLFRPTAARRNQLDLSLTVVDNPKAGMQLSFSAEGSSEDVVFEGLASDDGDLVFKDCIVGRQQQVNFMIKNVGTQDCRFAFTTQSNISFVPRVGHLRGGKIKDITATFFSDHQIKQTVVKLGCQIMKIQLDDPNAPDWDDSMKIIKFVQKDSLKTEQPVTPVPEKPSKKGSRAVLGSAKKLPPLQAPPKTPETENHQEKTSNPEMTKIVEVKEEPIYTVVGNRNKDIPLRATIVADFVHYAIDTTDIAFSPTMMYQTRYSEAKLTNNSQIRFDYSWRVMKFVSCRTDYALTKSPPFSVEPVSGFIEPGCSTIFKVKFSPEEVDDFSAELRCDIPFLSQMDPPVIAVTGLSRRPLCHFNVELSDYLTRRHPDYTYALPDDIKVIEIFSKGIGHKTVKKFDLINPTASPYEGKWKYIGEGATPINCDTRSGLISSGKKVQVVFEYTPQSVKTVESLWEFQIAEHSIRIQFLFVGKIMPM